MKKIISLLLVSACSLAHAEYTTENKIIKVVIPQTAASGLGATYLHIEAFAKKQNINMVPIFKPGAEGKIGINYASKEKNDGNTLLLTTTSDYVNVTTATDLDFDKVAPIQKIELTLVASKKSKIKDVNDIIKQEQENPGKLAWAQAASAQVAFIDNFTKATDIDMNRIRLVPFLYNGVFMTSIVNGDVDLAFIISGQAESFKDRLTIVDIDEQTKQKMSKKENAVALFLPKNSTNDSNKFWNKFVKDLSNDEDFKEKLKKSRSPVYTDTTTDKLNKIISDWKQ